jgi:polysaccharide deacetylase family protein (PEP-CTERM system associated)
LKNRILFTVDVEDYYMSPESIPVTDWGRDCYPDRLAVGMNRLLDLLAEFKIESTFFWLGWLAERHPELVKRCHSEGHEIGTHTYDHRPFTAISVNTYRESLKRSLGILGDLTGRAVISHRAPMWSVMRGAGWIWEEFERAGIRVDSSIYPIRSYLFGDRAAPRFPYWGPNTNHRVLEIPPATVYWFGTRWPLGGGGYLRAYPSMVLHLNLWKWRIERKPPVEGLPEGAEYAGEPVVYIHPWELDPDHPQLPIGGREERVHWLGLRTTEPKLRGIFKRCSSLSFRRAFGLVE